MTSRGPYWCPKTILWELNSFLMQTLPFVPINLHRWSPREWKHSIEPFHTRARNYANFLGTKERTGFGTPTSHPPFHCHGTPQSMAVMTSCENTLLGVFSRHHGGHIGVPNQSCGSWTVFLCKCLNFVPIILYRCWSREWKGSIGAACCFWTTESRGSVVRVRWRKALLFPSSFSPQFFVSFRSQ